MKFRFLATLIAVMLGITFSSVARAQTTNGWTDGTGKWEIGANWSFGAPNVQLGAVLITNAGNKTITLDGTTAGSPSTLKISNLVLSASLNNTNALFLNSLSAITPFNILNGFTIKTFSAEVRRCTCIVYQNTICDCYLILHWFFGAYFG